MENIEVNVTVDFEGYLIPMQRAEEQVQELLDKFHEGMVD